MITLISFFSCVVDNLIESHFLKKVILQGKWFFINLSNDE